MAENRILFVDDDSRVLAALRRILDSRDTGWDLTFAAGAYEGLESMAVTDYEVVVSDLTMPHLNGLVFLQQVRNLYPEMIRVLMSGTESADIRMKATPVAHKFLSKPWSVPGLLQVLGGALDLHSMMSERALQETMGGLGLPELPPGYRRLCGTLEDPSCRFEDIAASLERDKVVARLMVVVLSGPFAPPRPLRHTIELVRYLGRANLKYLVLFTEAFAAFDVKSAGCSMLSQQQEHALHAAKIAVQLAEANQEEALCVGLLHDIGRLILADRKPEQWAEVIRESREGNRALEEVTFEHFGTTHAEVGAYLLSTWGLPQEIVEAVANQHASMRGVGASDLASVAHRACLLADG